MKKWFNATVITRSEVVKQFPSPSTGEGRDGGEIKQLPPTSTPLDVPRRKAPCLTGSILPRKGGGSIVMPSRNDVLERGFTLVELMIVLVVIALLVAISAVGALSMRVQTNEGLAKSSLKSIVSACESYRVSQVGYPADLAVLETNYLGGGLQTGEKSGYKFELKNGNSGETFTCTTVPKSQNYTGTKSFCIDTNNVINTYDSFPALTADGNACPSGGTLPSG